MTSRDRHPDATTLAEDDLLLDQLGRGEAVSEDPAAALLSEWRSALPDGEPPDELVAAATAAAARRPARWGRSAGRRAVVLATTTVLLGGGVAAAAEHARPGNPLWPVTEWLYPDLAGSRSAAVAAGTVVADARTAIEAGRTGDAIRLLEHAGTLAERVTERGERDRLLSDIAALRARITTPSTSLPPVPGGIPAGVATTPAPSETTQPSLPSIEPPSGPSAAPSTVAPGQGEPGQPQDVPTSTPGLPAPLPSPPLEPTLPGIPAR